MNRRLGQDPFSSYVKSCPPADGGCDQRFADGPPTGICALRDSGDFAIPRDSHPPARGARQAFRQTLGFDVDSSRDHPARAGPAPAGTE